jgi:hypothetical protein
VNEKLENILQNLKEAKDIKADANITNGIKNISITSFNLIAII